MRTVRVQGKVRVRVKFGGRCRGGEISHIYLHTCTHTHARGQGLFQVSKRHRRCARLAFSGAGGLRRLEVLVGRILTLTPTLNPKPEPGGGLQMSPMVVLVSGMITVNANLNRRGQTFATAVSVLVSVPG